MRKYLTPETKSLQVNAQTVLCGSASPAPARSASIETMNIKSSSINYL